MVKFSRRLSSVIISPSGNAIRHIAAGASECSISLQSNSLRSISLFDQKRNRVDIVRFGALSKTVIMFSFIFNPIHFLFNSIVQFCYFIYITNNIHCLLMTTRHAFAVIAGKILVKLSFIVSIVGQQFELLRSNRACFRLFYNR